MVKLRRGDCVVCRSDARLHPGFVKSIGRDKKTVTVDWGAWCKRMLIEHLVKPKEVYAPGLSGNGRTAYLIQPDGEEWPKAGPIPEQ